MEASPSEGYFVAIGSNLTPEIHIPIIASRLVRRFGVLWLSSVIRTKPCGMVSQNDFLNAVCFVPARIPEASLKACLTQVEIELGRDRSDPDRKIKDRAADLDILLRLPCEESTLNRLLPSEPYIAPMFQELANLIGLPGIAASPVGQNAISLPLSDGFIGQQPVRISTIPDSGQLIILQLGC